MQRKHAEQLKANKAKGFKYAKYHRKQRLMNKAKYQNNQTIITNE